MEEHYNKYCSVEVHVQTMIESKKLCTVVDLVYDSQGRLIFLTAYLVNNVELESTALKETKRRSLRRRSTQEFSEEDARTIFEFPMGADAKVWYLQHIIIEYYFILGCDHNESRRC